MLTIADISDNNGAIDFAAASAAVDGYMVKATQFTNYTNLRYAEQLAGARQYGKANGQYHYAQPQRGEPIPQAQWFLAQMDWRAGELPALDLEEGDGDLTDWALAWLVFVESVLHIPPAIYTFPDFAKNHLTPNPKLARYPLWWASWNTVPAPVPAPWHTYTLWQYTDNAVVPGIGPVDLSRYRGTVEDWQQLAGAGMPDEAAQLKSDVAALTIPAGSLLREGIVDLSAFGGGSAERIAAYEKGVYHRLNGTTVAAYRYTPGIVTPPNVVTSTYESLYTSGKVVWY